MQQIYHSFQEVMNEFFKISVRPLKAARLEPQDLTKPLLGTRWYTIQGAFHSSKKSTIFLLKQKDSYKIPTKTIEIPAEGVRDF